MTKHSSHVVAFNMFRLTLCEGFDSENRVGTVKDQITGDKTPRNANMVGMTDEIMAVLNMKVDVDKSHKEVAVTGDHYDMAVDQLDVNEGEHGNLFEAMAYAGQQDVSDLAHWESKLVDSDSKHFYKKTLNTVALAKRDTAIQRVKRVQAAKAFTGSMERLTSVALDPQGKLRTDDAILKGYYRLRNAGAQSAAKLERFNKPKKVSAKMRALLAK